MTTGFILVGHGTRNEAGRAEFLRLAAMIAEGLPSRCVRPAFLELAEPTIRDTMAEMSAVGVTHVVGIPIILLAAAHVKDDIPSAVKSAAEEFGIASVSFLNHLGCRPAMLELSIQRFKAAVPISVPSDSVGWVLVGRGTRDSEALNEIQRFMHLREERMPTAEHWLGFLAMAEPKLEQVLEQAALSPADTIIVQPHLLFQGDLLGRTDAIVGDFLEKHVSKNWILAEHLGPHELIADSVSSEIVEIDSR